MRLIDADKLKQEVYTTTEWNGDVHRIIYETSVDKAPTVNAVVIPDGATNGDMIKAVFPNTESRLDKNTGITLVRWEDGTTKCYKTEWWNAQYKAESEDKE